LCCAPGAAADRADDAGGADPPLAFGHGTSWFAVRSGEPAAVARALGLADTAPAGWAAGLAVATPRPGTGGAEAWVYLSPPVDGWVFVVGSSLPYPDHRPLRSGAEAQTDMRFDHLFTALAVKFADVQFFGSYRAVGFGAWARARGMRIERIFSYAEGEVLANVGAQSAEERALKFPDLGGLPVDAANETLLAYATQRANREEQLLADGLDRRTAELALRDGGRAAAPDEADVLDLASAWSVDPASLEGRAPVPGTGLIARLPPDLRQ